MADFHNTKPWCAEYKRMLKHMREPGASLSVIPEGIKGGIILASPKAFSHAH